MTTRTGTEQATRPHPIGMASRTRALLQRAVHTLSDVTATVRDHGGVAEKLTELQSTLDEALLGQRAALADDRRDTAMVLRRILATHDGDDVAIVRSVKALTAVLADGVSAESARRAVCEPASTGEGHAPPESVGRGRPGESAEGITVARPTD